MLIDPGVAMRARHITVNELLLAAQQHETSGTSTTVPLENIRTQLVLARTESNSPDLFAAAVGAIQTNSFVRRVSWIFDCIVVLIATGLSGVLRRFSRVDLVLGAIAFSAAYCLLALVILSRWSFWLPGWLPLGAVWISVLLAVFLPKPKGAARTVSIASPPPTP